MASVMMMSFGPAAATTGRAFAVTSATKGTTGSSSSSSKEEKGFLDWLLGSLQKDDGFLETDPILKKVEDKSTSRSGTTSGGGRSKNSVPVPPQKKGGFGGFGGLFAKN